MNGEKEPDYRIGKVLFSSEDIRARTQALADEIVSGTPSGQLLAVGILNGASIFLSDLVRCMPPELDVKIDFMSISSYGNSVTSSGAVRILKDIGSDIEGKDVVIVEDIIDTGLTLSYLLDIMWRRKPAALRTCVLFDKQERREVPVKVDYRGFVIPDVFVVGYGLDYAGRWRHLKDLHAVEY